MSKDFYWIRLVIDSCTSMFQLVCCRTLITLFSEKYINEPTMKADYNSLLETLEAKEIMIACEGVDI